MPNYFLHVIEIDASEADFSDSCGGLSVAQFESLVASDVQKRPGKKRDQVGIHGLDDVVGLFFRGGEHVAVRTLGYVGIDFVLQHVVEMSEGLLLGKNGDVEIPGVVD